MSEQESRTQDEVEASAMRRLMRAMSAKADLVKDKYGNASLEKFRLEPHEQALLQKMNNSGLVEGFVAGAITLLGLRYLRGAALRKFQAAQSRPQQGNAAAPPSPMQQMIQQRQAQQTQNNNNPFQQGTKDPPQQVPKETLFSFFFGWTFDGLVGLCVAIAATVRMANVDKMIEDISLLPLAPGDSSLCREFCPLAVDWIKELEEESAQGDEMMKLVLTETKAKTVDSLLNFARNCDLRLRYQQRLRKEKGVSNPGFRIAIPPPGVPLDLDDVSSSSSPSLSSSSEGWSDEKAFETDDIQEENLWANGFVEDQEESRRRT